MEIHVDLSAAQVKRMQAAHKKQTELTLGLTAKQVSTDGVVVLHLNKRQAAQYNKARAAGKGVRLTWSRSAVAKAGKQGGFINLLLAALPGLLSAAPDIGTAFIDGFKNVGKLLGIPGSGLVNLGQGVFVDKEDNVDSGAGLKNFGEGLVNFGEAPAVQKKGRKRAKA